MFAECVLKIEGDTVTALEVVGRVDDLMKTLQRRSGDGFLSEQTKSEKTMLIRSGLSAALITKTCKQFFGKSLLFLKLRFIQRM